jgi:hypothetical protein
MTLDDIIRMAIKAGDDWTGTHPEDREFLIRFAGLIATAERAACEDLWEAQKLTDRQIYEHIEAAVAAEREACAELCLKTEPFYGQMFAEAIRARGYREKQDSTSV